MGRKWRTTSILRVPHCFSFHQLLTLESSPAFCTLFLGCSFPCSFCCCFDLQRFSNDQETPPTANERAHTILLTNFKLILLTYTTFFKLLLLTGTMRGQFCNYFPSVLFPYREVQNLQKWMDKIHKFKRGQCLPRNLQKRRSQSQNCSDDSHAIISPIQCIKVLIAGMWEEKDI